MISIGRAALGNVSCRKTATQFDGQAESTPQKLETPSTNTSPAPTIGDRFEALSKQVDQLHEGQQIFFEALYEIDKITARMMDDHAKMLENQAHMLRLLNQLVPDRDKGPATAPPAATNGKLDTKA